jgi:pyruvate formate lyase activating enzyme
VTINRIQHEELTMKEALLYDRLSNDVVRCNLCAHHCRIAPGEFGICRVRKNIDGTLYTLVDDRIISRHVDPVEKKPLFHFYPGSKAYSVATSGCNFRCAWCQNWQIAQMPRERHLIDGRKVTPEEIVAAAKASGSHSIAYTYTEPTVFFELAYDTARLAHAAGLVNIYVTNGFMTEAMLTMFAPYLDAANVDLKAFHNVTYQRYVGARLQPVLDSMKTMKRLSIWLEVTTLIIPDLNDDPAELRDAAAFVAQELGPETPWHISRFYPAYKMLDRASTPIETLKHAKEIGLSEGLKFVYVGNAPSAGDEDTYCPQCGCVLIRRHGFGVLANHVQDGHCPDCGAPVAGIGMDWEVNDGKAPC